MQGRSYRWVRVQWQRAEDAGVGNTCVSYRCSASSPPLPANNTHTLIHTHTHPHPRCFCRNESHLKTPLLFLPSRGSTFRLCLRSSKSNERPSETRLLPAEIIYYAHQVGSPLAKKKKKQKKRQQQEEERAVAARSSSSSSSRDGMGKVRGEGDRRTWRGNCAPPRQSAKLLRVCKVAKLLRKLWSFLSSSWAYWSCKI